MGALSFAILWGNGGIEPTVVIALVAGEGHICAAVAAYSATLTVVGMDPALVRVAVDLAFDSTVDVEVTRAFCAH